MVECSATDRCQRLQCPDPALDSETTVSAPNGPAPAMCPSCKMWTLRQSEGVVYCGPEGLRYVWNGTRLQELSV